MIAVSISEMIETCLQDRQLCRVAGIPEIDANSEAATHVIALAVRLRDRYGGARAMRIAFLLWNELEPGAGEAVH
jgi:hypothetical protein